MTRQVVHQARGNPAEVGDCLIGANGVVVIILNDPGVGVNGISVSCHGRIRMMADNKGGGLGFIFYERGSIIDESGVCVVPF